MSIAVTNLNFRTSVDDLFRAFSPFGEMNECRIVLNDRNESKGYAFVGYDRNRDAIEAIQSMNGFHIDGRSIRVGWAANARAEPVEPPDPRGRALRAAPRP
jgi:RNA recognition motif-containing protein